MLLNFLCRNSGFLFFLEELLFKKLQGLCIIRSLIFKVPTVARLERQPVYLSTMKMQCQAIFLFFSEFFIGFLSEILQFYF